MLSARVVAGRPDASCGSASVRQSGRYGQLAHEALSAAEIAQPGTPRSSFAYAESSRELGASFHEVSAAFARCGEKGEHRARHSENGRVQSRARVQISPPAQDIERREEYFSA